MRDLHIHDLRRTLGSWLASGGINLPIIGKALNDKSPDATKVYASFDARSGVGRHGSGNHGHAQCW
jgi:integrase